MGKFKVCKSECKNCLFSKDALVSPARVKDIVADLLAEQKYFICHVSSMGEMESEEVCCNRFYHQIGHKSQLIRIAERLGMIEFVEVPDKTKLPSYLEQIESHKTG